MKFSDLPVSIRDEVTRTFKEGKVIEANDRMRYFAENGYTSAEDYRLAVLAEKPSVNDLKEIILLVMKQRFIKYGFEAWMDCIPGSKMICQRYKELKTARKY